MVSYTPKGGVPKTMGAPGVAAGQSFPQLHAATRRAAAGAPKDNKVNGPAYQPFPSGRAVAGTSGPMSRSTTHSFGKLDTPIKKALGARKAQGPSQMLKTGGVVKPKSGY